MSYQRTEKIKLVANLKEKYLEMKDSQPLTMAISNAGAGDKIETNE